MPCDTACETLGRVRLHRRCHPGRNADPQRLSGTARNERSTFQNKENASNSAWRLQGFPQRLKLLAQLCNFPVKNHQCLSASVGGCATVLNQLVIRLTSMDTVPRPCLRVARIRCDSGKSKAGIRFCFQECKGSTGKGDPTLRLARQPTTKKVALTPLLSSMSSRPA